MRSRWRAVAVCVAVLLAIWLVFGQTVGHGFVGLDDESCVYENAAVKDGLSAKALAEAFTDRHACTWVPLCWISHIVDCQLYGVKSAAGHHLTNVLLHGASAVLLLLVLRRMTGRFWPSAMAATLFAIHPLRAESVAWVTERRDVLSGLCFVLTLAAYAAYARGKVAPSGVVRGLLPNAGFAKRPRWPHLLRYAAVLAVYALGLMSKSMLITLPLILLLLDYWPLGRMGGINMGSARGETAGRGIRLRGLVVEKVPLAALAAAAGALTMWAQGEALAPNEHWPPVWRIENALISYVGYLAHFFYPAGLAVLYPRTEPEVSLFWKAVAALAILASITATAWSCRRRRPYLLVGWLWYLIMLLPAIGLVQFGVQAVADRFTYLAQIGIGIALAWAAADAVGGWASRRAVFGLATTMVLAVLIGGSWRQASFWRDSETLWIRTLSCTTANGPVHGHLAVLLANRDRIEDAVAQYRWVLDNDPQALATENALGLALARLDRLDEAMAHHQRAVEIKPDLAEAHNNLGLTMFRRGWIEEAMVEYEEALRLRPEFAQAHNNMGRALADRGQRDEAMEHYREALRINPYFAEAHYNFGNALAASDRHAEAMPQYETAVRIKPDFVEALNSLGNELAYQNRLDEALATYEKVLGLQPNNAETHNNLGVLAANAGRLPEAVAHYQRAIRTRPEFADAHYNLGNALANQGKLKEAVAEYRRALEIQPDFAEARESLRNASGSEEAVPWIVPRRDP